jgi:hypothetical protein
MRLEVERVHYMPTDLELGILYVSDEFDIAIHLCACGCGSKIKTPLGPTEWSIRETPNGPSLHPSVGNWQQPCKSHYWIDCGEIKWAQQWTDEEIIEGRQREEERRRDYYEDLERPRGGKLRRFWNRVKGLFTHIK